MIKLDQVEKRFKKVHALRGLSFEATNGRVTALLGPNGSGKTTSVRIASGLLRADAGTVVVDDEVASTQNEELRSRVGLLPHNHGLYKRLTARENVRYFGRLQGLSETTIDQAIEHWFGLLDMDEIADRRTEGFSEGQRVKVALVRALLHDPDNVILDEPTSGLDVASTRAVRGLIGTLRDEGKCVLLLSHIMSEVAALCDHIVVIADGAVVTEGTLEQVCAHAGHDDLEEAFLTLVSSSALSKPAALKSAVSADSTEASP